MNPRKNEEASYEENIGRAGRVTNAPVFIYVGRVVIGGRAAVPADRFMPWNCCLMRIKLVYGQIAVGLVNLVLPVAYRLLAISQFSRRAPAGAPLHLVLIWDF